MLISQKSDIAISASVLTAVVPKRQRQCAFAKIEVFSPSLLKSIPLTPVHHFTSEEFSLLHAAHLNLRRRSLHICVATKKFAA